MPKSARHASIADGSEGQPLLVHAMDDDDFREEWESVPPPPADLWDTKDATRLEMVKCDAYVRVSEINPKAGHFRVRMKCIWAFRTLNSKEDAEVHLRGVPGIRMPGLIEVIEESRIWKDLTFHNSSKTTGKTVFWRGISLLTMDGFKCFQMHQFPFDRHILNLERLEFVWRPDKDAADYYKSMKICSFKVHASSMLPEWEVRNERALITALNGTDMRTMSIHQSKASPDAANGEPKCNHPPTYASKFTVRLRIERKYEFYAWQVFLVTYLITILTCTPLGMKPSEVGDRLSVYVGGTLTLVAFKYGVSDHLPSVPYQTFTDKFLLSQVMTVFCCGVLSIISYRITHEEKWPDLSDHVDWGENVLGLLIVLVWTARLIFTVFIKPRESWRKTWKEIIDGEHERRDEFAREDEEREQILLDIDRATGIQYSSDDVADLRTQLDLSEEQAQKLAQLQKKGLCLSPDNRSNTS